MTTECDPGWLHAEDLSCVPPSYYDNQTKGMPSDGGPTVTVPADPYVQRPGVTVTEYRACTFSSPEVASTDCSTEVVPGPLVPDTTTTTAQPLPSDTLPATGAETFVIALVGVGLLVGGIGILAHDLYRRYRARRAVRMFLREVLEFLEESRNQGPPPR